MQLLDSCALPEAQFATLTVLLQLNDIYDSQHGNQNVSGLSSEKDERGESSHSLPPPEDGDQNSESRDTEGNHCEKNEDDEADKSAGSTNNPLYENEDYRSRNKTKSNLWRHPKRRTEPMTHAVLRESMTVISPTTLLPEGAHSRSMESLEIHLMQEFGFRDDFRRIGGPPSDVYRDNEESCDTIVDHDHGKRGESEQDQHDVENNLECDDGGELNGRNGRSNSRVRFHTDTKDGAMDDSNVVSEKNAPSLLQNRKMMEYEDTSFPFENQLAVKSYSPPSFHLNCSLGLTLFYVTVFVEDIGELSEGCNGIIQDGQLSIEKDTTKTLKHCAAVLLPNVSWQKTHSQFATASRMEGKRGGMVILTVGITGPAYDLYGASPVVANLPQRLRECVRTLSALNTVSPSHIVKLKDAGKQTEHRSSPQQQKHASPKRSFIKTKSKPSSYRKDIVTDPSSRQSHQPTSLIAYDHSYFRQLYRALLASLLNDDDGYLSSRNIAPSNSSDFGMPGGVISSHKIDGSVHSHQSSSPTIDSESSIPPNHDSGSSGGGKKKLFTFSRKRNSRTTTGYETGDSISSGTPQDNKNDASDASFPSDRFSSQVPKAAEIVERMSLQLEVLSLAEEDMALPLYSKYECSADMLSVGNVERKRLLPSTSPKVSLASHGGTTHVSGRFGKPAAPSDLSGFDFKPKPSSSRPHVMNSAGSVSGLSSTSLMGSVSDDASILTGNDTATTSKFTASSSSQSSVPTLSKSKRDLMTTSSRSLFVQRRKAAAVVAASPTRAGVEANAGPSKPPLFPHERQTVPMPLFDPFGVEQNEDICDDVSKEKRNDDNAEEALSIASVSTKDTAISGSAPPSPLSRINGTISNSSSRDGSDVGDEHSLPQEHGPSIKGPLVRLDVALALNEDLTCEYKKSKLSTLSVEGTLQVRVKSTLQGEYSPKPQAPIPFFLVFQDHFSHIKSLQENKKFVEHLTLENGAGEREFIYCVSVPKEEEFYPIVRYKCSSALRPVPIRVQSRVRVQGNSCRVALQISSNPQNPSDLAQLTIIMSVPTGILGETLRCNPPGGVWNDEKKVVLWCVSELGGGEKFQLQAMFDIDATLLGEEENLAKKLEFPVLARCQCSGAQLSAVAFEVTDMPDMYPAEVSKSLIRRFRVSHKEK